MAESTVVARLRRRLRILVVVDDCTRECLAPVADTSISGIRVARELDRLLAERGKPKTIVSDCQTAPSRPRTPSCNGPTITRSTGTTSRRASRFRMPLSSCSSDAGAMSCQRDPVPLACAHPRRARRWRPAQHRPTALAARRTSPAAYAAARRSAAPRSTDGPASRTAAITAQEGITDRQTPIAAG